jgi:hypothetical protein
MYLHLHAKNMLLKPDQFLHFLGHILGHKLAPWHTRTSISHEGIGTNGSCSWLVLLHIELLDLVRHTLTAEILTLASVNDELHDIGSVRKRTLADHSIKHLIEDKVHNIKSEVCSRIGGRGTLMGIDEKIHQRASDSIVVPSTWSNILPEDTHKKIIRRPQTSNLTRNTTRFI